MEQAAVQSRALTFHPGLEKKHQKCPKSLPKKACNGPKKG